MKRKYCFLKPILFFLGLLCLGACQSRNSGVSPVHAYLGLTIHPDKIDRFLKEKMKERGIPGMSYALVNDGKVVYYRVLGYADLDKKIKADTNTIWEAASISKSVFAYLVMKFVEEGKLDLDKALYQYLPYPDIAYDERYKKITARMVLSHRSGFPNWRGEGEGDKLFIQFEPGSDYFYSGEGFQYLALVLKHLSKTNWAGFEEIFQEKVARPLGMKHSRFIADAYIRKHKARAYDKQGKWIDKLKIDWWKRHDTVFVAPTTLMTEPRDFSKWLLAIIKEEGLKKESFDEMLKIHSVINASILGKESYALGFFKMSLPFGEFYAHSGNNTGYTSIYALNKEKKWASMEFNNADQGGFMGYEVSLFMLTGYKLEKYLAGGLLLAWGLISLLINALIFLFSRKKPNLIRNRSIQLSLFILVSLLVMGGILFNQGISSPMGSNCFKAVFVLLTILATGLWASGQFKIIAAWKKGELSLLERIFQTLNYSLFLVLAFRIYLA